MKLLITLCLAVMFAFAGMFAVACVFILFPVVWAWDSVKSLWNDDVPGSNGWLDSYDYIGGEHTPTVKRLTDVKNRDN